MISCFYNIESTTETAVKACSKCWIPLCRDCGIKVSLNKALCYTCAAELLQECEACGQQIFTTDSYEIKENDWGKPIAFHKDFCTAKQLEDAN